VRTFSIRPAPRRKDESSLGVRAKDSGIASALLNASQQIGVALGLAILSTVSVSLAQRQMPDALNTLEHARAAGDQHLVTLASDALVLGYGAALATGAAAILIAALIAGTLISTTPSGRADASTE